MRMWGVDPRLMCRAHLLGEHVEMHMFAGCILKGKSIDGYIRSGLVDLDKISFRHDELAYEMERRGYSHCSPLPEIGCQTGGRVDTRANLEELARRCRECAQLQGK